MNKGRQKILLVLFGGSERLVASLRGRELSWVSIFTRKKIMRRVWSILFKEKCERIRPSEHPPDRGKKCHNV